MQWSDEIYHGTAMGIPPYLPELYSGPTGC
jgi:hypothetical protein